MLRTVAWTRHGEHEYVVIGDGVTIDATRLQSLIDETFEDSLLYLSPGRHAGFSTTRQEAATYIAQHVRPGQGVIVTDSDLHVFLQVNPVGVARTGVVQADNQPNPLRGSA